jgi:HSP20 family protein
MFYRTHDLDRTFSMLDHLRREMDRAFSEYDHVLGGGTANQPFTNVYDEGNAFVVVAEVPGLSEKELDVRLNQDVLTLSGELKAEVPEGYSVHRRERGTLRFSRSYVLPARVDPERVEAILKDGLLTVRVEKAAELRPRQISVRAH